MDYDYYDESRTRFQLQSGPLCADPGEEKKKVNLLEVGSCSFLALLSLGLAWYCQGFLQFSLLWLASALFVGPFAPSSATGGDCRVGVGELLPSEKGEEQPSETENLSTRNSKQRRKEVSSTVENTVPSREQYDQGKKVDRRKNHAMENGNQVSENDNDDGNAEEDAEYDGNSGSENDDLYDYEGSAGHRNKNGHDVPDQNGTDEAKGEAEWTPAEMELLKKLMVRYPKGMLKRWEVIAESFDGLHSVESVVKMSKAMSEKRKSSDDSYSDFLAKRKGHANVIASPLSQRWDSDELGLEKLKNATESEEETMQGNDTAQKQRKKKSEWTDVEDKALLSALKAFPKDTPMRWEKVALAVPTRTKQQCFRRYSQLKESFRNKTERS